MTLIQQRTQASRRHLAPWLGDRRRRPARRRSRRASRGHADPRRVRGGIGELDEAGRPLSRRPSPRWRRRAVARPLRRAAIRSRAGGPAGKQARARDSARHRPSGSHRSLPARPDRAQDHEPPDGARAMSSRSTARRASATRSARHARRRSGITGRTSSPRSARRCWLWPMGRSFPSAGTSRREPAMAPRPRRQRVLLCAPGGVLAARRQRRAGTGR